MFALSEIIKRMKKILLYIFLFLLFFLIILFYSLPYNKIIEYYVTNQGIDISIESLKPSFFANFHISKISSLYDDIIVEINNLKIKPNLFYLLKLTGKINVIFDDILVKRNNLFDAKLNNAFISAYYKKNIFYSDLNIESLNLNLLNNKIIVNDLKIYFELEDNILNIKFLSKELNGIVLLSNNKADIEIQFENRFIQEYRNFLTLIPHNKLSNNIYRDSFNLN
jgi:hypothetical protein